MSVAENLLRLHRWQLEERRRYLLGLESLAERLRNDLQRLTAEIDGAATRLRWPQQTDLAGNAFGQGLLERRAKLEHSIAEIETQITGARAAMHAAESEFERQQHTAAQRSDAAGGLRRAPRARDMRVSGTVPVRHKVGFS